MAAHVAPCDAAAARRRERAGRPDRAAAGGAPVFGGSAPPCRQACSKWCTCSVRSAGQSLALRGGCSAAPAVDATHAAKASRRTRRAMRAAPRARAARAGAHGDKAAGGPQVSLVSRPPLPFPSRPGHAFACAVRALRFFGASCGVGCAARCGTCAAPCAGVPAAARKPDPVRCVRCGAHRARACSRSEHHQLLICAPARDLCGMHVAASAGRRAWPRRCSNIVAHVVKGRESGLRAALWRAPHG